MSQYRGRLWILLGQGDGTFAEGGFVPAERRLRDLVAVDVDQDGIEDLVVNGEADDVAIYLGRGDGTFAAPRFYATGVSVTSSGSAGPDVLVPADLDNDGRIDFVVRSREIFHFLIRTQD